MATRRGDGGGVEDNVRMLFRTQDGALGTGTWDFVTSHSVDSVIIEGSEGQLEFAVFINDTPALFRPRAGVNCLGPPTESAPSDPTQHVHQPLVEEMVKDLLAWKTGAASGSGELWSPQFCSSTGVEAMATTEVMDTVLENYYSGRQTGFWKSTFAGDRFFLPHTTGIMMMMNNSFFIVKKYDDCIMIVVQQIRGALTCYTSIITTTSSRNQYYYNYY
ncbi:unnamed protein product [Heterosigma akashiwo]